MATTENVGLLTYKDENNDLHLLYPITRMDAIDGMSEIEAKAALVSNPNLLDNWYFLDPINRRGQTSYSGAVYAIDRWRGNSSHFRCEITEDGLRIYSESSSYSMMLQILENPEQYFGKTVTLTILYADGTLNKATGTIPDAFADSSTTLVSAGIVSLRISAESLFVTFSTNSDYTVVAVKLELGSVQTLAHQDSTGAWVLNDPPPNKQQELAKCQRYQWVIDTITYMAPIGFGRATSTTSVRMFVPTPVEMRSAPSVTADLSVCKVIGNAESVVPTAVSAAKTPGGLSLAITVPSATTNQTYVLAAGSAPGIIFDSNL